jgi:Ca2+/Na+ antiporter
MKPVSPPLTYRPAYVGLFAALFLAMLCNVFLDIQYGAFTFEAVFWAVVFAITLRIGWRQRGEVSEGGRQAQKIVLLLGAVATVLVFMPLWGFPRAGLAMLAMLQAAQNCVTVSRRQLHMGLLVSIVMVMFAATHFRADWTMLFYLLPYVVAVVFTLVAEQVSRRAEDTRRASLGGGSARGQGAAILAAVTVILAGGVLLYSVTPQVTWPSLFWKYGQPGNIGFLGQTPGTGQGGQPGGSSGNAGQGGESAGQEGGQGSAGQGARGNWPTPAEMREAAGRKGMPQWQASAIRQMADLAELTQVTLTPIRLGLDELLADIRAWLKEHEEQIRQGLLALIFLALLIAAWFLFREARLGLRLGTWFDYLRLGLLPVHAQGNAGVYQYYRALQRLMDVHGQARHTSANTREFLAQVAHHFAHLQRELIEMTFFFERARYGDYRSSPADLARIRANYRRIFHGADLLPRA